MKDDLKSLIESLHVPGREGDYWDSFPNQVLRELRRPVIERALEPSRLTRYGWNAGFALGCIAACFCLWQASTGPVSHVIGRQKSEIRHALLHFHDNVNKVMRDEHGLHRLIEEAQ
ncbi:MAG: hypothetical protein JWO95_3210 [Verrucomicrobiales bacterium]|nr:hypothetical protein [Verrucomicrobiales bacterium]